MCEERNSHSLDTRNVEKETTESVLKKSSLRSVVFHCELVDRSFINFRAHNKFEVNVFISFVAAYSNKHNKKFHKLTVNYQVSSVTVVSAGERT